MTLPDFQTMMRPLLACLGTGAARSLPEIRAAAAEVVHLTADDQLEMLPSGKQSTFSNRVAWALSHMSYAGLVERPLRARYRLTDRGRQVLLEHPDRVDMSVLSTFEEYRAFRAIKHTKEDLGSSSSMRFPPAKRLARSSSDRITHWPMTCWPVSSVNRPYF